MNITGPIQSSLPPINDNVEQFLKVNQRIAGEVLNISNEQVVLAVNGVQIVAKMTSAEQLAVLLEKRYAYFIVKDITENQITLQLAAPAQTSSQQKATVPTNLGQAILEKLGISIDSENLLIVQAALDHGVKVTPELVKEIKNVLESLPQWGTREANLAIAIKSAGLPLTQSSLSLAQNAVTEIKTNFIQLYQQLEAAMNRPGLTANAYDLVRNTLATLKEAIIQTGNSIDTIERNLAGSIKNLGVSLENEIAKALTSERSELFHSNGNEAQLSRMNGALFSLANLRHELNGPAFARLHESIDNFVQGMKWMHFINVEPDHPLPKGQWTQFDLPITFTNQTAGQVQPNTMHELQIKIAHENNESDTNKINSAYTRLVVQVDLNASSMIKVDLSIVSNMIGAEITATNDEICLCASEELGEFQTGLANLGYTLKTSKVELGSLNVEMNINQSDQVANSVTSVDLGI